MSYLFQLKENYTLSWSGEPSLSKLLLLHSENGSSLKGQKLLPFTVDPFSEGSCKAKKTWWHNTTRSEALIIRIWTNFSVMGAVVSVSLTTYWLYWFAFKPYQPDSVAQSLACLTADPGGGVGGRGEEGTKFESQLCNITFAEIDHEIIATVTLLFRWFKKASYHLLAKVYTQELFNSLESSVCPGKV